MRTRMFGRAVGLLVMAGTCGIGPIPSTAAEKEPVTVAEAEKEPVTTAENEPTPAAPKEPVTVDFSKGPLTVASGQNSLTLGAWFQLEWIGDDRENFDADTSGSGVGEEDGFSSQFKIARMRLYLLGSVYRSWLRYKFEFELSNTSGDGSSKIKDAYMEIDKNHWASVRLGQFKVPYSLQQLTPDRAQNYIDRAITDGKFAVGRDIGVMLTGVSEKRVFGYNVGGFNGGGESKAQDDQGFLWAARTWWDPLGEYKLSAGAIDNTDKTILHFGAAARTGEVSKGTATTGVFEDPDNETAYNAEFAWRFKRLWATAEYFQMTDELANPVEAPDVDSRGALVEFSGLIVPASFEMGVRYAEIDPDTDVDDDKVREIRALAVYYVKGQNLKFQFDAGQIHYDQNFSTLPPIALRGMPTLGTRLGPPEALTDYQYRFQAQVAF